MVAGPYKKARPAQDCQEEEKIAVVRPIVPKGLIVLHPLGILVLVFSFSVRKIPFAGIELTSQRVRRLHGYL